MVGLPPFGCRVRCLPEVMFPVVVVSPTAGGFTQGFLLTQGLAEDARGKVISLTPALFLQRRTFRPQGERE